MHFAFGLNSFNGSNATLLMWKMLLFSFSVINSSNETVHMNSQRESFGALGTLGAATTWWNNEHHDGSGGNYGKFIQQKKE